MTSAIIMDEGDTLASTIHHKRHAFARCARQEWRVALRAKGMGDWARFDYHRGIRDGFMSAARFLTGGHR